MRYSWFPQTVIPLANCEFFENTCNKTISYLRSAIEFLIRLGQNSVREMTLKIYAAMFANLWKSEQGSPTLWQAWMELQLLKTVLWKLVTLLKQTAPFLTACGTCTLVNRWPQYSEVLLLRIVRICALLFFLFKKIEALGSRYSDFPTVSTTDKSYVHSRYQQWIPIYFGASTRALASTEPHVKSVMRLKLLCSSRLFVAHFRFTVNLKLDQKWLKSHHPNIRRHTLFHVAVEVVS